jgi:hypothetical protein
MNTHTTEKSFLRESFDMYDKWSTQLLIYFTVFFFSTAEAVLLGMGLHVPKESVLLYVLPMTVVLMVVVPMIYTHVARVLLYNYAGELNLDPLLQAKIDLHTRILRKGLDDRELAQAKATPGLQDLERSLIVHAAGGETMTHGLLDPNPVDIQGEVADLQRRLDDITRQAARAAQGLGPRVLLRAGRSARKRLYGGRIR